MNLMVVSSCECGCDVRLTDGKIICSALKLLHPFGVCCLGRRSGMEVKIFEVEIDMLCVSVGGKKRPERERVVFAKAFYLWWKIKIRNDTQQSAVCTVHEYIFFVEVY